MRQTHAVTLAVLIACTVALPWTRSASADHANAAWWYQRAISRLSALPSQSLSDAIDWASDPVSAPSPEIRELLSRAQSLLADFRRGTMQSTSDFGLDYSQGFEMMLPALGPLRRIAHLNRIDGMVALHDGDHARAVRAAEGMLRLSAHLPADEIMISSLVGTAVYTMADGFIESCLGRGAISADDARRLAAAMDGLPDRDPFGMVESLAREQSVAVDWLSTLRDADDAWSERIAEFFAGEDPETAAALASMDDDAFSAALGQYDAAMSLVVDAFSMEDRAAGAAALAPLLAEVERGEHGPLVQLFMPAVGMLLSRLEQNEAAVRARREHLIALADGRRDPLDEINAAAEYLEAGRLLTACDEDTWQELMQDEVPLASDESRRVWTSLHALLDGASRRRRCDFDAILRTRPLLAAQEAPGLRACLRALRAAAARPPVDDGSTDAGTQAAALAADLHAIALRMIAHLSGDTSVATALVASEALDETHAALSRLNDAGALDREAKTVLAAALRRIPRSDPCAHVRALKSLRDRLAMRSSWLRRPHAAHTGGAPAIPPEDAPPEIGPDGVGAIACLYDLLDVVGPAREACEAALLRLGDLLDQDAVEALVQMVRRSTPASFPEWTAMTNAQATPPARLEGRSAEARAMLRRIAILVRVAGDAADHATDDATDGATDARGKGEGPADG